MCVRGAEDQQGATLLALLADVAAFVCAAALRLTLGPAVLHSVRL